MIHYVALEEQWQDEKDDLMPIIEDVLCKSKYVHGIEIDEFEKNISEVCCTKFAVALNSGTDALKLALQLVGVNRGDEVITQPNSYIATAAAIVQHGAKPVFVDVCDDLNIDPELIEQAITSKTKAILPAHLTGRIANMGKIMPIASKYNIPVIEDAAQATGSYYDGRPSGSFGKAGCFSVHPLKNLNACGDGGFLTTNDETIYRMTKLLRNHGLETRDKSVHFGFVSRMDSLQAAILNYRLGKLNNVIEKRRENAKYSFNNLNDKHILLPIEKECEFNTYHTFIIQTEKRDALQRYLNENSIITTVHYPTPIHLQPAATFLGYTKNDFPKTEIQAKTMLSLPVHQFLCESDLENICCKINEFFNLNH